MSPELEEMHWATAQVPCPRCGSGIGERCINPLTNLPSHLPCFDRMRALETDPSAYGNAA